MTEEEKRLLQMKLNRLEKLVIDYFIEKTGFDAKTEDFKKYFEELLK